MSMSEDELLPISALQHLLFCERQCALIHVEQAWDENRLTARAVLALPDGPSDTPCFHAQQAVEKALKAFLTAHGVRFRPVHGLMAHCDAVISHVAKLKAHRERITTWPTTPRRIDEYALSLDGAEMPCDKVLIEVPVTG